MKVTINFRDGTKYQTPAGEQEYTNASPGWIVVISRDQTHQQSWPSDLVATVVSERSSALRAA